MFIQRIAVACRYSLGRITDCILAADVLKEISVPLYDGLADSLEEKVQSGPRLVWKVQGYRSAPVQPSIKHVAERSSERAHCRSHNPEQCPNTTAQGSCLVRNESTALSDMSHQLSRYRGVHIY